MLLAAIAGSFWFAAAPAQAAGASLFFSPGAGTYTIKEKFTVTVKATTGGQAINASEGVVSFDKNLLEVTAVSKGGSIFSLWTTEPSFSNANGTVSFGGGLPPPGYSGSSGKILSITFRTKAVGTAQIRFTTGAILANDGKGSNILVSMGTGSFNIAAKEEPRPEPAKPNTAPTPPPPVKKEPEVTEYNLPVITSPTHPDQNSWSGKNEVEFKWELPAEIMAVSMDFNKDNGTVPEGVNQGLFNSKIYSKVEDGTRFFHLRYFDGKKWGTAAHYRVLIDTVGPLPFKIEVMTRDSGNWPTLDFKASDALSGVGYYDIFINSLEEKKANLAEDLSKSSLSFQLPALEIGEHTALIRAVDLAGNETTETVKFTVQPIETPIIKNYPREIKSSDQFFISGTALENILVNISLQAEDGKIIGKTAHSDKNGNWFEVFDRGLADGRYLAWVEGENSNGLKSVPSEKVSFLVSPPIFARIGSFVINYFTVIASLLFMIILIVFLLLYIIGIIRRKLKKETVEIEEVLHKNMVGLKRTVDEEFSELGRLKKPAEIKDETEKMKSVIAEHIAATENKILKEIKDVEEILK